MTYCEKYGFDEKRRTDFLHLLDLSADDRLLAGQLQDLVIKPNVDAIVEDFYTYMLQQPVFMHLIEKRRIDLNALKIAQKSYLLSTGVNFDGEEYFEGRLRIGIAHAWNHVPLSQYLGAYRILQQIIIDQIPRRIDTPDWHDRMRACLLKVLTLDMLLAVETYHEIQVHSLENTVSTLRNVEARLKMEVAVDQLTKLASRAHAMDVLTSEVLYAHAKNRPLSVIMADLDHFKDINDRYGHPIGDRILMGIAARIKTCVRDIDTVGRYGGEEILIILPHADPDMAQNIAERILNKVSATPFAIGDYRINMTISEGISTVNGEDTVDSLIMRSDAALYRAKRTGRNRIVIEP